MQDLQIGEVVEHTVGQLLQPVVEQLQARQIGEAGKIARLQGANALRRQIQRADAREIWIGHQRAGVGGVFENIEDLGLHLRGAVLVANSLRLGVSVEDKQREGGEDEASQHVGQTASCPVRAWARPGLRRGSMASGVPGFRRPIAVSATGYSPWFFPNIQRNSSP